MLVTTRERTVNLSQDVVYLISTLTPGTIALLESKVGCVPLVWISTTCPGPAIDVFSRVLFHPLRSWVLAGLVVPVASVDESLLGWQRHLYLIAILLSELGLLLQ